MSRWHLMHSLAVGPHLVPDQRPGPQSLEMLMSGQHFFATLTNTRSHSHCYLLPHLLAVMRSLMLTLAYRVGTILFTALGISVAAIALHACMRVPDDLFTDEAEVCLSATPSLFLPLGAGHLHSNVAWLATIAA